MEEDLNFSTLSRYPSRYQVPRKFYSEEMYLALLLSVILLIALAIGILSSDHDFAFVDISDVKRHG